MLFCGRDPGVQGFRDGALLKRFAGLRVGCTRIREQNHQRDYAIRVFHGVVLSKRQPSLAGWLHASCDLKSTLRQEVFSEQVLVDSR
jgi:hypothetical protein